jgi:TPR repeat protein
MSGASIPDAEVWHQLAAAGFYNQLPPPKMYGETATQAPRRDVIGWVAGLVGVPHVLRWLGLCAALRKRHPFGSDAAVQDASMVALTSRIIEHMVLPLRPGETRRVLTTNIRRHVRRSAVAGLTFMLAFDWHLALFDLEEGLHRSKIGSVPTLPQLKPSTTVPSSATSLPSINGHPFTQPPPASPPLQPPLLIGPGSGSSSFNMDIDMTDIPPPSPALVAAVASAGDSNDWQDILALQFFFNTAVERFRDVCQSVGTRHVRAELERVSADHAWARAHARACGLDSGQARILHLVILNGSSCEDWTALMRSHFTVYAENEPLVFAAALSTLDPVRAILVADTHVGLTVVRDAMLVSRGGTTITLNAGRSASNVRKLLYGDALIARRDAGVISQSGFMHLTHKLTMLNSGLGEGTPGSRWAAPWPHWPALDETDKELLAGRYARGNIVAGGLLAATMLANHIEGIGSISRSEYLDALEQLKKLTELGDAAAPSYVAMVLAQPGPGLDIPESVRYYRMAVERGNKNAPALLGKLLLKHNIGDGAVESVDLFKLSIARGGRFGSRYLAEVLETGAPSVARDPVESRHLYDEAARFGDPVAFAKLNMMKQTKQVS